MSDLSHLLEDLYGDDSSAAEMTSWDAVPPTDAPAEATTAPAPSWSSDDALDDLFASWVPGEAIDAPEAPVSTEVPVLAGRVVWSPSDDDILPARRGRRTRRR